MIISTFEQNGNVVELEDGGNIDDLPRYSVRSIINRKMRFELFETLADAEVYVEELKSIISAIVRKNS